MPSGADININSDCILLNTLHCTTSPSLKVYGAVHESSTKCITCDFNIWGDFYEVFGRWGLGLNFGRIWIIDLKYFGRSVIDLLREQENGRNREIHRSTYLGAGRLTSLSIAKNTQNFEELV